MTYPFQLAAFCTCNQRSGGRRQFTTAVIDMFYVISLVSMFLGSALVAPLDGPGYPDCNAPKAAGNGTKPSQKFYFDETWNSCFAFKYSGSGGNTNRFDTRRDCEIACLPADGTVCTGPGEAFTDPIKRSMDSCDNTECPKGYVCMYGMGGPTCCLKANSEAVNEGYHDKCPDGSKADGLMKDYFIATFAHSCEDLICGPKKNCQQVNQYFAKCCETK
uniref:BPTI/Kunitz inhibitor domain-containing protein n=1 Tax=Steinernema glaseri TaxID=37863 RepID=A0A1I8ARF4_9BILA